VIVLIQVIDKRVLLLVMAMTHHEPGDNVMQFIFAEDAEYLNVALRVAREPASEQAHQRGVSI